MVFEETITIECFWAVWPLPSMVLRWFFDVATIAFNGFRWFRTIGQSMRWFRWIVVVSYRPWIQLFYLKKMKQYSHFWKQYSRFCNLSRLLLAEGFKPNDRRDNTSFNFTTQLRKRALCCGLQAYLAIFNTNLDAFKFETSKFLLFYFFLLRRILMNISGGDVLTQYYWVFIHMSYICFPIITSWAVEKSGMN